jgi:hypothetical protein
MDLTKLGRTERVLAIVGLLAFIDSFLPWWSVSAGPYTASESGWNVGFAGWFPLLLLFAVGVLVALPAFGQSVVVRGGYAAFGAASLLATIIILIRWLTYPSGSDAYAGLGVSAGASFGTYIGLILGIVATVFSYLAFTAAGGSINKFADAFKAQPAAEGGYVPPAGGYAPPPEFGQSPEQPAPGTWQQPPQQ